MKLLCVEGLGIEFEQNSEKKSVLHDLSLQLDCGSILAIVGESGSGKSLTSLAVMGLLPPSARVTSGRMEWNVGVGTLSENNARKEADTVELLGMDAERRRLLRARSMSMVFQEPMTALNPTMKCGRQIMERVLVMKSIQSTHPEQGGSGSESFDVGRLLEEVELTDTDRILNSYPHQLSGGQRQRLMLAMALVGNPRLMIADEPTTALDARVQASLLLLLNRLVRSRGLSMLLISHDLGLVDRMADDILVLRKGKTMEYGPAKEVLRLPRSHYTSALLASRLDPSKKGTALAVLTDDGILSTPQLSPKRPGLNGESPLMLEINRLTVRYPLPSPVFGARTYRIVLESIDLSIMKGRTLGLVGESGSGKSTLSRVLVGLIPQWDGEIRLNGQPYHPIRAQHLHRARQVQMIFQDPYSSLNPSQKIGEILSEVVQVHRLRPPNAIKGRVGELLQSVGIDEEFVHRYPTQLSGGQRQRVVIARALAAEPRLLVCDESVSSLDVSVQAQVLNLLKSLQDTLNLTYLFISHDLSVVYHMSDEIAVLHQGRIVEMKKATDLYANPEHPYTRLLLESTNKQVNKSA